ncbi:ADP-ribosylation factor-like protein 15-like [Scleropages formosus]|uniref:ADP-ribosylation factor-like protein 15 n=1 Tax=Scleropages formosus TaxID=113540 RepID=A0A0P7VKY1_SCLFO|nr:ADP-ribosylation factor-like protein 15-like [Scleropages formosus]
MVGSEEQCFRALCCKGPPPPRPEYDVVCIGLTGAGKTSLLSRLCSEGTDNIVPTTGFSIKAVPFQNAILNVKELGGHVTPGYLLGADTIKKYWSRYYQGSQGVIFVLDSACSEEDLEAARTELHSALQHPQLCTLPFLILANHQDKPAARSVQEVTFHTKYGDPLHDRPLPLLTNDWASPQGPLTHGYTRIPTFTPCQVFVWSLDSGER